MAGRTKARNSRGHVSAPKRENGEGSVFWRASKQRYCAQVSVDGKYRTRHARTEEEAYALLAELRRAVSDDRRATTDEQTLAQYLAGWLAWKQHDLKPHSYSSYKARLQIVSEHATGKVQMKALKAVHFRRMYGDLRTRYSSTTLNSVHRCLSTALKQAVADGLLTVSPLATVAAPRLDTEEQAVLPPADLKRLFDTTENMSWRALWIVLGTMGLRIGEALALKWQHVNWRENHIHVQATVSYGAGGGLVLQPPKTKTSKRMIHMGDGARKALLLYRERMQEITDVPLHDHLVFPNTAGGLMRPHVAGRAFYRDLDRAGLERVRLHDLRHSAASNMLARGVHVKVVQEMLGHASHKTTMDLYGHVTPAMHREAMALMDKELFG